MIYAGNKEALPAVEDVLEDRVELHPVANIRPSLDVENLGPAREEIHELFLKHVVMGDPFPWDLREGAKGVQLAELGLESWEKRAWVDVPELAM